MKCPKGKHKNTVNTSPIIHLVSNSLAHPENMASNFKISYNEPFDLCGKRVALVDATFTKSQPNILQESKAPMANKLYTPYSIHCLLTANQVLCKWLKFE